MVEPCHRLWVPHSRAEQIARGVPGASYSYSRLRRVAHRFVLQRALGRGVLARGYYCCGAGLDGDVGPFSISVPVPRSRRNAPARAGTLRSTRARTRFQFVASINLPHCAREQRSTCACGVARAAAHERGALAERDHPQPGGGKILIRPPPGPPFRGSHEREHGKRSRPPADRRHGRRRAARRRPGLGYPFGGYGSFPNESFSRMRPS
jgi:hypothetical protein